MIPILASPRTGIDRFGSGLAAREHLADHAQRVLAALARRDVEVGAAVEQQQADLVAVLDRAHREQRRQLDRGLELAAPARAEVLRRADVDQQHHRQLALLDEPLDVRLAGARGDVPVDRADVVAGHVRAHLVELHAASLEHG